MAIRAAPLSSGRIVPRVTIGRIMQQSMYSPTHPTAGQPGGYLGVCCLFKPLGCGGFLKYCPQIDITGFVYIDNHSDYSSDCYKIIVLILQNIEAVMSKFSGGVDVRQSCMFKVMGGGGGYNGVSHVQGDGRECRGVSHVQGDGRGVSHVQGDCRGVRGVSNVEGDRRGEGRQPCSR